MAATLEQLEHRVNRLEDSFRQALKILSQLVESQKLYVTSNQVGEILAQKQKQILELQQAVGELETQLSLIINSN